MNRFELWQFGVIAACLFASCMSAPVNPEDVAKQTGAILLLEQVVESAAQQSSSQSVDMSVMSLPSTIRDWSLKSIWRHFFVRTINSPEAAQSREAVAATSDSAVSDGFLILNDDITPFLGGLRLPATGESIRGQLLPFYPLNACNPLTASSFTRPITSNSNATNTNYEFYSRSESGPVIVYVSRGDCTFEDKIRILRNTPRVIAAIMINNPNFQRPDRLDVAATDDPSVPIMPFSHVLQTAYMVDEQWQTNIDQMVSSTTVLPLPNSTIPNASGNSVASNFTLSLNNTTGLLNGNDTTQVSNNSTLINETNPFDIDAASATGKIVWIQATLLYNPVNTSTGVVELSLAIVVILLAVAFLSSLILHCHMYRTNGLFLGFGRRDRANANNNSEANNGVSAEERQRLAAEAQAAAAAALPLKIYDPEGALENLKQKEMTEATLSVKEERKDGNSLENAPEKELDLPYMDNANQTNDIELTAIRVRDEIQPSEILNTVEGQNNQNTNTPRTTILRRITESFRRRLGRSSSAIIYQVPEIADMPAPDTSLAAENVDSETLVHVTKVLDDACAICLDEFTPGDRLRELPCHHFFHAFCIDPWLRHTSPQCPLCKSSIILESGDFQNNGETPLREPVVLLDRTRPAAETPRPITSARRTWQTLTYLTHSSPRSMARATYSNPSIVRHASHRRQHADSNTQNLRRSSSSAHIERASSNRNSVRRSIESLP